jgi:hypothetical protein
MKALTFVLVCIWLLTPIRATAFEVQKSALFVFLHDVKPVEEAAAKALEDENYALALRKYREAAAGYERIWKEYPDLPNERPLGIDRMVDDSLEKCEKIIKEIREKGEAQDEFYQKLNEPIRVDFPDEDIRNVARSLTFLTDVNIIVDETIFRGSNDALNPQVSVRTNQPWPLKTIITRMCQQTGLAYSIEDDHVFISTRIKLDDQK